MTTLYTKLLQLVSRSKDVNITNAQDELNSTYTGEIVSSVGYAAEEEVPGTITLTQKTDFSNDIIEGTALVHQYDLLRTMASDTKEDEEHDLSYKKFERNYKGDPELNVVPESTFEDMSDSVTTTDFATTVTKQEYASGYMYNLVTVSAPLHYEDMLQYLESQDIEFDAPAELNEVK